MVVLCIVPVTRRLDGRDNLQPALIDMLLLYFCSDLFGDLLLFG